MDLLMLLGNLNVEKVNTLVGIGVGAGTALAFAAQNPDRVERLVACGFDIAPDASADLKYSEQLRYIATWPTGSIRADKAVANWFTPDNRGSKPWQSVHAMVNSASVEGIKAARQVSCGYNLQPILGSIQCQTLFLVGSEDAILPEIMAKYPELMDPDQAKLQIVGRSSHMAMLEKPERFAEAMLQF
jgi:pimeloyl-ACP methyl ester carboxylesterase